MDLGGRGPLVRAVVSDIGRVLLWFDNDRFLAGLAGLSGRPFEEVKAAYYRDEGLVPAFDGGLITPLEFHARVMRAAGADVPAGPFFRVYCDVFTPNTPVIDVLTRARESGRRVVLLSNIDPVRAAYIREHFPALGAFDGFIASSELRIMKPEPAIYLAAARLAGSPPEECVFIDDAEENVAAASAVDFTGIRYVPDMDLSAELKKLGLVF